MIAIQLQNIVRRLSNGAWCRYWLCWEGELDKGPMLAVHCREAGGRPRKIDDAKAHGFTESSLGQFIYVAPRTNKDGTPYKYRTL